MRFFLSYARRDRAKVESLAKRLGQLGHETWLDSGLAGGQAWWDEILARIRAADAFVLAVSEASLESEACTLERGYARSLGKPLLPVAVEPVQSHLLPPDLAPIQFVDYSTPGEDAAIQLASAIARLPPAAALPEPLPPAPPIPVSYLSDLSQRVVAPSLTLEQQRALFAGLEDAVRRSQAKEDPEEYEAALDLLRKLEQRPDLYAETARKIADLTARTASFQRPGPMPAPAPAQPVTVQSTPPPVETHWKQPVVEPRKTPRWIVALAVVGALFLLLLVGGALGSAQQDCFQDAFGQVICT